MSRAFKSLLSAMILTSSLAALPARAEASTRVYVQFGPPVRVVEARPYRRHHGYVWAEGYHRWDGHRYTWRRGYWVRPPRAHAYWVPAHWVHSRYGWYLVRGHWRY